MDDPERARGVLDLLRSMGIGLSIDDFGTGHASLAYLQRLPVAELKIDRGFVSAMTHSAGDEAIVRSTIDMAHDLGPARGGRGRGGRGHPGPPARAGLRRGPGLLPRPARGGRPRGGRALRPGPAVAMPLAPVLAGVHGA